MIAILLQTNYDEQDLPSLKRIKLDVSSDEALAMALQEGYRSEYEHLEFVDGERQSSDSELACRLDREQQKGGHCSTEKNMVAMIPPPSALTRAGFGKQIERQATLPEDLIERVKPAVVNCSVGKEVLLYLKNVDGCQGQLLAGRVLDEIMKCCMTPPAPSRGNKDGIVVEWHRDGNSKTPWHTGIRVLHEVVQQLLNYMRQDPLLLHRLPTLRRLDRSWNDTEVLVSTPGCELGRHHDAQPVGSLLFIFCAGLSCRSLAWPGNNEESRQLESGDVMVLDGTMTAHAVPEVIAGTSPFTDCSWLSQRRLSVLVREIPPCSSVSQSRVS